MKVKRIICSSLIVFFSISSIFASFSLPLEASSSNGNNQVIGSIFYLGSIGTDYKASSIGVAAFYHNKMSDNIGIYANGGVAKPLFLEISNITSYSKTTAVCIQSGPYYIIPIEDNMLVKVGIGLDLAALGGTENTTSDENIVLAVGLGAFGSFEYELIDRINILGSLTIGYDPLVWMTDVNTNTIEKLDGGKLFNIMPSVGVSYHF